MKNMQKIKVSCIDELTPLIGKKVFINDKEIGLFLTNEGEIFAVNNICPHKEGPLSEGNDSGNYIYCPLHDQKIDLKTGDVQEPDTGCVETYPVEVVDGDIFICL